MTDFMKEIEKFYTFRAEEAPAVRKVIARRMVESKRGIPHFYLIDEIDMDQAVLLREELNAGRRGPVAGQASDTARGNDVREPGDAPGSGAVSRKVSFNDMVVRAAAIVLGEHPEYNVAYAGGSILRFEHVNVGIAVAVEGALLVPVVRECEKKDLFEISVAAGALAAKARSGKLRFSEGAGGTITVSNLGMYGIKGSLSIINPPQAMILTVGSIRQVPVVRGGRVEPGRVMMVTLSCDHRAVDGALGSEFLASFKHVLESPRERFP